MSSRLLVVYGRSLANDHIVSALEARSPGLVKVAESATPWDILRRTSRRRGDTLLSKLDKFLFYAFYAAVLARPEVWKVSRPNSGLRNYGDQRRCHPCIRPAR